MCCRLVCTEVSQSQKVGKRYGRVSTHKPGPVSTWAKYNIGQNVFSFCEKDAFSFARFVYVQLLHNFHSVSWDRMHLQIVYINSFANQTSPMTHKCKQT